MQSIIRRFGTKFIIVTAALALIAAPAIAQPGPGFPTRTPAVTRTPTPTPVPVIAINQLPPTFAATTADAVGFAFRQAFFAQFYKDAVALNSWSAPTGTNGFSAIDLNPNIAIQKFVQFLIILRRDGHGLFDLLAERHDSTMTKVAQAFRASAGNVSAAAEYTESVQGISSRLALDNIVATDAAAGIDALSYVQISWCDVAPDIAYAAFLRVGPQLAAQNPPIPQRPFPCAIPTPTPTPVVTPTPTATATATPTPTPSLTPTATPPGGFTITITCTTCTPVVVPVPPSGATITVNPK